MGSRPIVAAAATLFVLLGMPLAKASPAAADKQPYPQPSHGTPVERAMTTPTMSAIKVRTIDQDWFDKDRNRRVPVKIYRPAETSATHLPVILFSHGLGGSRDGYVYLGNYWAEHGYIAVFMQHIGSDESLWKGQRLRGRNALAQKLRSSISPKTSRDRVRDTDFAVKEILRRAASDEALKDADVDKIGMAGHSYGAWTTLVATGMKYGLPVSPMSSAQPRVKAAVYLSPTSGAGKLRPQVAYGSLHVPAMHITGKHDDSPIGLEPAYKREYPYKYSKGKDQYLLVFNDADHMVFAGVKRLVQRPAVDSRIQMDTAQGSTKFFDAYLKGDASAKEWLRTKFGEDLKGFARFEFR